MLYQPKKTIVILVYACRLNLHFLTGQQDPNVYMAYQTIKFTVTFQMGLFVVRLGLGL